MRSVTMLLSAKSAHQPGFGKLPIAHDRLLRDLENFRGFLDTQPTKKPQLYDLAFSWILLGQSTQGSVDGHNVHIRFPTYNESFVPGDMNRFSASLQIPPRAGQIGEDTTHHPR